MWMFPLPVLYFRTNSIIEYWIWDLVAAVDNNNWTSSTTVDIKLFPMLLTQFNSNKTPRNCASFVSTFARRLVCTTLMPSVNVSFFPFFPRRNIFPYQPKQYLYHFEFHHPQIRSTNINLLIFPVSASADLKSTLRVSANFGSGKQWFRTRRYTCENNVLPRWFAWRFGESHTTHKHITTKKWSQEISIWPHCNIISIALASFNFRDVALAFELLLYLTGFLVLLLAAISRRLNYNYSTISRQSGETITNLEILFIALCMRNEEQNYHYYVCLLELNLYVSSCVDLHEMRYFLWMLLLCAWV